MGKKRLKFLSFPEALEELNKILRMQSELKKQEEIASLLARFGELEVRKHFQKGAFPGFV